MQEFKIRYDSYDEIKRKTILKRIPFLIVTNFLLIFILNYALNFRYYNPFYDLLLIGIISAAISIGTFRGLKRTKEILESYKLIISENSITREQLNIPSISIPISDITKISKNYNGSFTIWGKNSNQIIGIPAKIENYEGFEYLLNQIMPVKPEHKSKFPVSILSYVLFAVLIITTNKILIACSGSVISFNIIYSFIQIERSKHLDNRTKRLNYWSVLVLASVVGITFIKLTSYKISNNSVAEPYLKNATNFEQNGEYLKAIEEYKKVIKLDPEVADYFYETGRLYNEINDYSKSKEYLSKAISLRQNFKEAYLERGYAEEQLGDTLEALMNFATVISQHPKCVEAYNRVGLIKYRQQHYEEALLNFNKAIKESKKFEKAYYNRANTYFELKNLSSACEDWKRAIELDSEDSDAVGKYQNYCRNN